MNKYFQAVKFDFYFYGFNKKELGFNWDLIFVQRGIYPTRIRQCFY